VFHYCAPPVAFGVKERVVRRLPIGGAAVAGDVGFDVTGGTGLPADLEQALAQQPGAQNYFQQLSRTAKRNALQGLVLAKRPATRQQRIAAILELANQRVGSA